MTEEIIEKELSYAIMKAAYAVHNELGPGFVESIYEEAMILQLRDDGHTVRTQVKIPVLYKGRGIGEHILDQIVDDKIILELKALSYLKATGMQLAIVINFGTPRVTSSRVVNTKSKASHPPLTPFSTRNRA